MKRREPLGTSESRLVLQPGNQEHQHEQHHQSSPNPLARDPRVEHRDKCGQEREHREIGESPRGRPPVGERLDNGDGLGDGRAAPSRLPPRPAPAAARSRAPSPGAGARGRIASTKAMQSRTGARSGSIRIATADAARNRPITCEKSATKAGPRGGWIIRTDDPRHSQSPPISPSRARVAFLGAVCNRPPAEHGHGQERRHHHARRRPGPTRCRWLRRRAVRGEIDLLARSLQRRPGTR